MVPAPQVQCFNLKEDQWSLRSPAPFSQRCLEAVSLEDTIYVVGGLMSKIFTYNPGTDVWGEAAVLPSPVVSGGHGVGHRAWHWFHSRVKLTPQGSSDTPAQSSVLRGSSPCIS